VRPHTVIWLDDAQDYLLTKGSDLGNHDAARLRTLLNDPNRAPVLVLATIWPTAWDQLTRQPTAAANDPHRQARQLLTGRGIHVPPSFPTKWSTPRTSRLELTRGCSGRRAKPRMESLLNIWLALQTS
jgi:hypothetical protein